MNAAVASDTVVRLGGRMMEMLSSMRVNYQVGHTLGLTWLRVYLGVAVLSVLIAILLWGTAASVINALTIVSVGILVVWWFQFVSAMYAMSTPQNMRLVPNLRRETVWLMSLAWVLTALLLVTFFFLVQWFFLAVFCMLAAASLPNQRQRFAATGFVSMVILCAAVWQGMAGTSLLGANFSAGLMLDHAVAGWAMMAGMLAVIGLVRVLPIVGLVLWLLWVGTMMFNTRIFGMVVLDPLQLVYTATSQTSLYLVSAAAFFCLLLVGMVGSATDRALSRRAEVTPSGWGVATWPWFGKVGWQWLPGFDYFLSRALGAPYDFGRLMQFTFGRMLHWSTLCWLAMLWLLLGGGFLFMLSVPDGDRGAMSMLFAIIFIPNAVLLPSALIRATYRVRAEHQMLSLTPRWPAPVSLNRQVAWHFAKYCMVATVLGMVMMAIFAIVYKIDVVIVGKFMLTMVATGVVLLAAVLRCHARMKSIDLGLVMAFWVTLIMLPNVLVTLTFSSSYSPGWFPPAAFLGITMLAAWRYRQFLRYPKSLPAGNAVD